MQGIDDANCFFSIQATPAKGITLPNRAEMGQQINPAISK